MHLIAKRQNVCTLVSRGLGERNSVLRFITTELQEFFAYIEHKYFVCICITVSKMALHHVMSANAGISKMAPSFMSLEPKLGRLEHLGLAAICLFIPLHRG